MNNNRTPKARQSGLVVQKTSAELLVYDIDDNKAHCLNETMAAVWQACDGKTTVADIARSLSDSKDDPASESIVWLAIDQLRENDLMEAALDLTGFDSSRRELLKKVGFASVVALPFIASLSAPVSTLAASSCNCAASGDCFTQPTCLSQANCNGSGICAP